MKNLKRQNPGQLFVAQELINKVIKLNYSVAELRVTKKLVIYYLSFQKKEVYLQSRTGPLTAGLVFIGHLIYLTGN